MYTLTITRDKIVTSEGAAREPLKDGDISLGVFESEQIFSHPLAVDRLTEVIQLVIAPSAKEQDPEIGLLKVVQQSREVADRACSL